MALSERHYNKTQITIRMAAFPEVENSQVPPLDSRRRQSSLPEGLCEGHSHSKHLHSLKKPMTIKKTISVKKKKVSEGNLCPIVRPRCQPVWLHHEQRRSRRHLSFRLRDSGHDNKINVAAGEFALLCIFLTDKVLLHFPVCCRSGIYSSEYFRSNLSDTLAREDS